MSKRGNKNAEVCATGFCWAQAYLMKNKSDLHEAFSLFFQRTGVPDKMIIGRSKEQVFGNFQNKCSESGCQMKQTEPHSPWKNAAEVSI